MLCVFSADERAGEGDEVDDLVREYNNIDNSYMSMSATGMIIISSSSSRSSSMVF